MVNLTGAKRLEILSTVPTTILNLLYSLWMLLVALTKFLGIKRLLGVFGGFLIGFGVYTVLSGLVSINIVQSELGSLMFFLGANLLAWGFDW